jgi:hypothetical protein
MKSIDRKTGRELLWDSAKDRKKPWVSSQASGYRTNNRTTHHCEKREPQAVLGSRIWSVGYKNGERMSKLAEN